MDIEKIPTCSNPPWDVNAIIEIPQGGVPVKYELHKRSGAFIVDRALSTAMYYPCNYGFLPHTLSEDGDPIDVLVNFFSPVVIGSVLPSRPVGVLKMEDESGPDEKIICVPTSRVSSYYNDVKSYRDLPSILCDQVEHFFSHYKDLEKKKWVRVQGWGEADEAAALIEAAIGRWNNQNNQSAQ